MRLWEPKCSNCNGYLEATIILVQDLHYVLERRRAGDSQAEDVAGQGIVPMETPFLMDQVMDDGMAACSIM